MANKSRETANIVSNTGVTTISTLVGTAISVTSGGFVAGIATINNINSSHLSVTGISTFSGSNVNLADNTHLRIGDSQDLLLFHNGNDSFIYEQGSGNLAILSTLGDITFGTDDGGSVGERLRIKGSSGNIGIGTTNPESTLHLFADNPTQIIENKLSDGVIKIVSTEGLSYIQSAKSKVTGSGAPLYFTSYNGNDIWTMIGGDGAIGIGSTGPHSSNYIYTFGKTLHVNHNITGFTGDRVARALGATISVNSTISYDPTPGVDQTSLKNDVTDSGRNTSLIGYASTSPVVFTMRNIGDSVSNGTFYDFIADPISSKLYLQGGAASTKGPSIVFDNGVTSRNVGIGTTDLSPAHFTIAGKLTDQKQVAIKDLTNNWVRKIGISSSNAFSIYSGDTEQITITSDGKIGVFETDPQGFIDVEATDAYISVHYSANSRGGIAALSTQRLALLSTNAADDLVFGYTSSILPSSANFTEVMRLDNGTKQLLKPYQCAFNARGTGDSTTTGSICPFDSEVFDIGGDFNTGTYKFTAPHTGRYLFYAHVIQTNTTQNTICELWLRLNGTGTRYFLDRDVKSDTGANSFSQQGTQILSLTAGDTIHVEAAGVTYNLEVNSHFGGYFLG